MLLAVVADDDDHCDLRYLNCLVGGGGGVHRFVQQVARRVVSTEIGFVAPIDGLPQAI